jgi:CheY-like chemotaxis protein
MQPAARPSCACRCWRRRSSRTFLFNTLAGVRSAIATDPARASEMIDRLVDYLRAAIPRLRSDGHLQATLGTQIEAVRAYLGLMAARMPRLQWQVDVPADLLEAACPPLMLISLAENAVKHGVERKIGPARITVAARAPKGRLALAVRDDGPGFQPTGSGTGIGLANIRERLAQLYPGQADLVLKARPTAASRRRSHCRSSPHPRHPGPLPTALIADDEDLPRAELRRMLATAWPELQVVAECEHGPAAIEALAAHAPDIAFLDIRMPGPSGLDVARAASGRCHVVFTTAYDSHAIEAFEAGAVDYLLKPVQADRLAQAVARLRDRWPRAQAAPPLDALVAQLASAAARRRRRPASGCAGSAPAWATPSRCSASTTCCSSRATRSTPAWSPPATRPMCASR